MKRFFQLILFTLLTTAAFSQAYVQPNSTYGFTWNRGYFPIAITIPNGDTVKNTNKTTSGLLKYRTTGGDSTLYVWDSAYNKWVSAGGGGGGADGNNYPTSLSFGTGTGILTLGRNGLGNLTTDFDGRYLRLSDTAGLGSQDLQSVLTVGNTATLPAKITELYLYDSTNEYYSKTKITDGTYRVYPNASTSAAWQWENLNFGFRWKGDDLSAGRNRLLADVDGREVISVNGNTANTVGEISLTTDDIPEGTTNLYFTDARSQNSWSLTTTGSSGAATYTGGVLNVPNYTLAGLGGISATLADGKIWVGNASNVATAVTPSGDVTITNAGVSAIGANKVTDAMIRQSAGLSVIGNSGTATANVADITGTTNQVLRVNSAGNAVGFGVINAAALNATYSNGQVPITDGSGNFTFTTITSGTVLSGTGYVKMAGSTPSYVPLIGVADGGTGIVTTTAYGLIAGGTTGTGAFQNGGTGTSGQVYISNGSSSLGTWTTPIWLTADSVTIRKQGTALQHIISYNAKGGGTSGATNADSANIIIGRLAGNNSMTGYWNYAYGNNALAANTSGFGNVAIGLSALLSNTTGEGNIAIGYKSMLGNTTGGLSNNANTAVGSQALNSNSTGGRNTAFGANALISATATSSNMTALGWQAGQNGAANGTYVGELSGQSNTGTNTTATGVQAGLMASSFAANNAVYNGYQAGYRLHAVGTTAIGYLSLGNNGSVTGTGAYNTALGFQAAFSTGTANTGGYNITIGAWVDQPSYSTSGQLNIGNVLYGTGLYQTASQSSTPTTGGALSVGITAPAASAILDLTSTTKGLLIPRMTAVQAEAITSPAEGLLVYVNSVATPGSTITTKGWWGYDGSAWVKLN